MDRLIYTALSGMRGAMARQTATANNLANANTTGFRAEMSSATALWLRGAGLQTLDNRGAHVTRHVLARQRHRGRIDLRRAAEDAAALVQDAAHRIDRHGHDAIRIQQTFESEACTIHLDVRLSGVYERAQHGVDAGRVASARDDADLHSPIITP